MIRADLIRDCLTQRMLFARPTQTLIEIYRMQLKVLSLVTDSVRYVAEYRVRALDYRDNNCFINF